PAAGALMSAFIGERAGFPDVLSFDMGGTTAKGAIIRGGKPLKRYRLEVAREHEFRAGSGLPLRIPVIDMIEIGAGGGSLASVDERGLLAVGPRSAGADPGPACYARGGVKPTLTDANTLLGFLVPERFLGGTMALDVNAATNAIDNRVSAPLNLDNARAAWGVHEVINEDVARAFRMHASELGFDYRQCTMVAFGGSGPVHALRVARKLGIPRVLFPPAAGVMSAIGLLVTPLSFETLRSERRSVSELDGAKLEHLFRPLVERAERFLAAAGVSANDITVERRLDMRYVGQGYEVEVDLPREFDASSLSVAADELASTLRALFDKRYADVFSSVTLEHPLEIINWKVEVRGPRPAVGADYGAGFKDDATPPWPTHPVYDAETGEYVDCPVVERYALPAGTTLDGPLLLQERESTCVIGSGERVHIDDSLNAVAELVGTERLQ
ncbi:MAG: hydantoinase/oxoprolinase family protein, partial [Pseudomonadota bacterium]